MERNYFGKTLKRNDWFDGIVGENPLRCNLTIIKAIQNPHGIDITYKLKPKAIGFKKKNIKIEVKK